MTTLEVLLKARAEVEKGWCQQRAEDSEGNVCAMGALARALGCCDGDEETMPYFVLLCAALPGGIAVRRFNDAPSTTQADVLALFDRAINALVPVGDSSHVHRIAV